MKQKKLHRINSRKTTQRRDGGGNQPAPVRKKQKSVQQQIMDYEYAKSKEQADFERLWMECEDTW